MRASEESAPMTPRELPKWVENTYGHDPSEWGEAKEQAREVLIEWARRYDPGTYGELVDRVTAIEWPEGAFTQFGGQIGHLLGQISAEEWVERRPLLSALAVLKGADEPSGGFYRLCAELPDVNLPAGKEARYEFWLQEVKRCRDYWKLHS
jgi:hypothetical protein